jgi:hypothetical protein
MVVDGTLWGIMVCTAAFIAWGCYMTGGHLRGLHLHDGGFDHRHG